MNINKPKWLPTEEWAKYLKTHMDAGGHIQCVSCRVEDDMTVDHIVPRIRGGRDVADNLQPMCRPCNSRKGARPDTYWGRSNYFDTPINRQKLRVSQNSFIYDVFTEYASFFSQPYSQINGKLFVFAQIVGAGKTLGMYAIPFALNEVATPGAPRVDKMMVVTKDKALREQIAQELREEPTRFGISNKAPRVLEVVRSEDLINPEPHDIAVMCPNLLWPTTDSVEIEDSDTSTSADMVDTDISWHVAVHQVIEEYPVVVFDEMHYAHRNIIAFQQAASKSLVFGVTASPIESEGDLLADSVRMSVYDYDAANVNDNSMKYLDESVPNKRVSSVTADDWKTTTGWLGVSQPVDISAELTLIRTVVNSTVKRVHELDNKDPEMTLAPHRDKDKFRVGETYPSHAIIAVANVPTAIDVENYLNTMFRSDRERFPSNKGYKAQAVWGKSNQKLDSLHPFFRYKNQGKLDTLCCRFLIVVDMATEGMNNKYCNVMGVAKRCKSIRQMLQRVGRLIRSTHEVINHASGEVEMIAPPIEHDSVHIVTHSEYQTANTNNMDVIQGAVHFMVNMTNAMADMMDIEEYVDIDFEHRDDDENGRVSLTYDEVMTISDFIGEAVLAGRRFSTRRMLQMLPSRKAAKKKLYRLWARKIYDRNEMALETVASTLFSDHLQEPMTDVAVDDKVTLIKLDVEQAKAWVADNNVSSMLELFEEGSDTWLNAVNEVHRLVDTKAYRSTVFETSQTVLGLLETLALEIQRLARIPKGKLPVVSRYVTDSALDYLQNMGATVDSISEGGKHDLPEIVQELRSDTWRTNVKKYVMYMLYQNGYLKNIEGIIGRLDNSEDGR